MSTPELSKRHTLILGGTFDPPHSGHIEPLLTLLKQWPFDDCWLMPNRIPPHKPGPHASNADRLAMLTSLCALHPAFNICELELQHDTPSYTVTTLTRLGELYPGRRFYFVMGMDSFLSLPSWYQWQSLLSLCHLVLCARPGYTLDPSHPMASVLAHHRHNATALPEAPVGKILVADTQLRDVSSSAIRETLRQGGEMPALVPEPVADVIRQRRLYR